MIYIIEDISTGAYEMVSASLWAQLQEEEPMEYRLVEMRIIPEDEKILDMLCKTLGTEFIAECLLD